ncbi:MAG: MtrB/PioB family outer membrane beta-barrel protein [Desulfuromonadales bacterium]|nr:MtrB/PioB family outer membrane beta-barrel protein [Desulfuromonadales bacterium]
MKQRHLWLLALLSILTLMTTTSLAIAEEGKASGHVEIGISGMETDDSPARVNEYVNTRAEEGFSFAPSLSLEFVDNGSAFDFEADIMGPRDQEFNLGFDFKRIFKFGFDHQVLEHWKDHDTLEHLGAIFNNTLAGGQPRVTTDRTVGVLGTDTLAEANERYYQEMANDYIVTRRETKAEASLTIPELPNITFHTGMRIDAREGLEQAITSSKCGMCHVQANGKQIDERTEDWTFGATGKFGKATIEYEYLTRDFTEDAAAPTYNYLTTDAVRAGVADDDQLLYSGSQSYKVTPDSEKDSHTLKARYDIDRDSSISAAYVNAKVESDKAGEAGTYSLDTNALTSEFESFFLKGATRIGGLRLSVRGGTYEINGPDYHVEFPQRDASAVDFTNFDNPEHYESAETREVTEFGIDGVYRLAKGTTLRLGYEYEDIDREEAELGETETHTFKVAVKSRLSKQLSGRFSYQYQNIDDPFHGEGITGIAQVTGADPLYPGLAWFTKAGAQFVDGNPPSGAVYYWNSVYPGRELDATTEPDAIHEAKFSATWTPAANMAATLFARVRMEENDAVKYQQETYVPGVSFYYAPNSNMNLTMAYTFNKQETENQMCVGWYHG